MRRRVSHKQGERKRDLYTHGTNGITIWRDIVARQGQQTLHHESGRWGSDTLRTESSACYEAYTHYDDERYVLKHISKTAH